MKYVFNFPSIKILVFIFILGLSHTSFSQKSPFQETFRVLESNLIDYFETKLSSEIDTTSSNGKSALFAVIQLVKTKTEMINKDLKKGHIFSYLDSYNNSALISIVYCVLVFEELDLKFVEQFLEVMIDNEMIDQEEKKCILSAIIAYNVDEKRIKDFSQKEEITNEFNLYLTTILGFFKGCNF